MDKARLVSDKDFQYIWSKILAEECNNNNTIPKNLLFILERMDKNDAEAFLALCKYVLYVDNEITPLIIYNKIDYYYDNGFKYDYFVRLDKLGLIEKLFATLSNGYEQGLEKKNDKLVKISYGNKEFTLPKEMSSISVGNVIFTREGEALFKAVTSEEKSSFLNEEDSSFWNTIVKPWLDKVLHD